MTDENLIPSPRKADIYFDLKTGNFDHPFGSEAFDRRADPNLKNEGWHYEVEPLPRIDHAAEALRLAQERFQREYPDADMTNMTWRLRRICDE